MAFISRPRPQQPPPCTESLADTQWEDVLVISDTHTSWNSSSVFCGVNTFNRPIICQRQKRGGKKKTIISLKLHKKGSCRVGLQHLVANKSINNLLRNKIMIQDDVARLKIKHNNKMKKIKTLLLGSKGAPNYIITFWSVNNGLCIFSFFLSVFLSAGLLRTAALLAIW